MPGLIDVVEGVEKLLLRRALARDELDIVHEEQIHIAVLHPEILDRAVLYRADHLVCEVVALDVGELFVRLPLVDGLSYRKEQVRLAEAGVAVDEQGIIGLRRGIGHRDGRRVRELVGVAHDEAVKGIARHFRQEAVLILAAFIVLYLVAREYRQLKLAGEQV